MYCNDCNDLMITMIFLLFLMLILLEYWIFLVHYWILKYCVILIPSRFRFLILSEKLVQMLYKCNREFFLYSIILQQMNTSSPVHERSDRLLEYIFLLTTNYTNCTNFFVVKVFAKYAITTTTKRSYIKYVPFFMTCPCGGFLFPGREMGNPAQSY